MKNILATVAMVSVLAVAGLAEAALTNIGTATYGGTSYNLIYDNDSTLVWFDYTKGAGVDYAAQASWASGLGSSLSISMNSGYSNFTVSGWRLPTAELPTEGWSKTGSEFGHLYYTELGNLQGSGFVNKGPFVNLRNDNFYWTSTVSDADPDFDNVIFDGRTGYQDGGNRYVLTTLSAMAVGTLTPTPIPAAAWLLGSGLLGLAGLRRKQK